jgi:Lrp/AsnC family transcriptional regulator, leucine-responsive regulatory protein
LPKDPRSDGHSSFDGRARLLDAVNLRLLSELQDNPRLSMSELARRVGMSAPAITERVQRLETAGVIVGYRIDVDPAALGMPVAALVRIRPGPGQLPKIAQAAQETAQVVECHRITGEDCFLLKIHAPSISELEELLDRFLLFGQTTTSIVVSTPVPPRPLPLPTATPG